jgi:FkbM family methyltransferase
VSKRKALKEHWRFYRLFGFRGVFLALKRIVMTGSAETEISVRSIEHPFRLRLMTSDILTYKQVFVKLEYKLEPVKPPRTILDAGANIGLSSIYFANRFPEAKIFAVEPERSNFSLLEKNSTRYANIVPIHAALWNENADVEIIDPGYGKWGFQTHGVGRQSTGQVCHKVRGVTVDKLMEDYGIDHIDILKMDIEGAEREVFRDVAKWIKKVGILVIELHERLNTGCNRSFYNATNDFDIEWQQGENVFLARTGWARKDGARQSV